MSHRFEIVEAKPWHVGMILRQMRDAHRDAIASIGVHPHRTLKRVYDDSFFRKAWLIDGKLAALGGVSGPMLSCAGYVWLVLTNDAQKFPIAIIKEARRQLSEIMRYKTELVTTVIGSDKAAQRLAVFLGFHVNHDITGSPAFTKKMRMTLKETLERNPDIRIPMGNDFMIAMGYHDLEDAA